MEKSLLDNAAFYIYPAYKKGMFRLPEPVISKNELDSMITANQKNKRNVSVSIEAMPFMKANNRDLRPDTLFYLTNKTIPKSGSLLGDRFIVLRSHTTKLNYLLCANPEREGRKTVLMKGEYYKNGFNGYVQKKNFPSGKYDIGLLDVSSMGKKEFSLFSKSLTVQDEKLTID